MDQSNRNLYINTLFLTSKIILLRHEINLWCVSTSNIHQEDQYRISQCKFSQENSSRQDYGNIWSQELETALFDFPLKQSYSEVYNTLLNAVQVNVKHKDLLQ